MIRSATTQSITLQPNKTTEIFGYTDKEINFQQSTAIIQESSESQLPPCIEVTPACILYNNKKRQEVKISLSNLSTSPVTISPRSILCEIQPVVVEGAETFDTSIVFALITASTTQVPSPLVTGEPTISNCSATTKP